MQKSGATASSAVAVVLPDGSLLGSREDTTGPAVLLPFSLAATRRGQADTGRFQRPFHPSDRLASVSQRLAKLTGRPPAVAAAPAATSVPPSLQSCKALIFNEVQWFTDAVFDHVLSDTIEELNRLPPPAAPSAERETGREAWSPAAADSKLPWLQAQGTKLHTAREPTSSWPRSSLLCDITREAEEVLQSLEKSLQHRYTPAYHIDGTEELRFDAHGRVHGVPVPLPLEGASPTRSHPNWPNWHEEDLRPALRRGDLPVDRIRELEAYRVCFRQHCFATREVGLRVSAEDDLSTATWLVWPYLADAIAMEAVDEAIEETHEAMERYVDDMIQSEFGLA